MRNLRVEVNAAIFIHDVIISKQKREKEEKNKLNKCQSHAQMMIFPTQNDFCQIFAS